MSRPFDQADYDAVTRAAEILLARREPGGSQPEVARLIEEMIALLEAFDAAKLH